MNDEEKRQADLRDKRDRELFALRHEEERMAREEAAMEAELESLEKDEKKAEAEIEEEWRREHWGHDPERPPAWRATEDDR